MVRLDVRAVACPEPEAAALAPELLPYPSGVQPVFAGLGASDDARLEASDDHRAVAAALPFQDGAGKWAVRERAFLRWGAAQAAQTPVLPRAHPDALLQVEEPCRRDAVLSVV